MTKKILTLVLVFVVLFSIGSCRNKSSEPTKGQKETAKNIKFEPPSPKELYFPPEEKPTRIGELTLGNLLEEYITPHLKALPLREKDKETLPPNTVAIRFNYPMVEKEKIGIPSKQGVWSFIPYRAGTYIWKDEYVLTFSPNRPWESDAEITGVLPTGLASLNKYKLLEPYQDSVDYKGGIEIAGKLISTDDITLGDPKIIGIDPPVGGTLGNVPGVSLIFDQPVLVDFVKGKVELSVKGNGESDFRIVPHVLLHAKDVTIKGSKIADNYTVLIKPNTAIPAKSEVKIKFAAGFKEADEYEAKFQTPMPLLLESISCQQWTACQVTENASDAMLQISITDATGFLKIKFNDSIVQTAGKEVVITPSPSEHKAEISGKTLYLSWNWQPNTNYTIKFGERFLNLYGFKLAKPVTIALRTGHLLPAIEAPIGLKAIDKEKNTALKLKWRNLSAVDIKKYPVSGNELASFMSYYFKGSDDNYFSNPSEDKPAEINLVGNPESNSWQEAKISTSDLLAKKDANIFFLQYETYPFVPQTPDSAKRLSALLQITDVGLSAKRLSGGLSIDATSMTSGAPISGVGINVMKLDGSVVADGETDKDGNLFIKTDTATDLLATPLILAEKFISTSGKTDKTGEEEILEDVGGEDSNLIDVQADESENTETENIEESVDTAYLWIGDKKISSDFFELPKTLTSTIDASVNDKSLTRGFVFTDKGVYRDGQTVHMKGFVGPSNNSEPKDVVLSIKSKSETKPLMQETVTIGRSGSFNLDWKVDDKASPGLYLLEAKIGEGVSFATSNVIIADTTNATFKLDVTNPKKKLISGDPWQIEVRPEYFFGLPVAMGNIRYSVYYTQLEFEPQGFEGYKFYDQFGSNEFETWNEQATDQKVELSGTGLNRLSIQTQEDWWGDTYSSPIRFYLNVTVMDISGDSMSADAEVMAYPSDYYIGLKEQYEYPKDKPVVFDWVALSSMDNKVLQGVEATAELYRLEDHWYQEEGVKEDSYYYETETLKNLIATCTTRSNNAREGCSLGIQPPGRYALKITSKNSSGMTLAASKEIAIAGSGLMPFAESKRHLIKPTADKESYKPGDTAYVLFENPYPKSFATVTVENETIMDRKDLKLEEGMIKVPIKIKEEYAPNAFVGVNISAPRRGHVEDGIGGDASAPTYLVGYVPIKVDLQMQRLEVKIATDKNEYQPKETIKLDITVTDGKSRPVKDSEVTLYAVDESALELTKYKTPEPLTAMYPEKPLAVEIANNRTKVYSTDYLLSVMEKGQVGGDGGMDFDDISKKSVRKEFPDTIFWKPDLQTDANGRVHAEIKLADATTSVRLMAVAEKDGRLFGNTDSSLKVRLPMSVDPILPRFMIRGDTCRARVRIHNTTSAAESVTLTLISPIKETKEIRVDASGTALASFDLTAPADGKELVFDVSISSKIYNDKIRETIPIHDDYVLKSREISGAFDKEQTLHLKRPDNWENANLVRLMLSSVPIPDLMNAAYGIMNYPYTSLATVVSSISAIATIRDRLDDFLPEGFMSKDVLSEHINARIKALLDYQTQGGGLSLWPAGSKEDMLQTANALLVLSQIKFDHDKTVYDDLKKRVIEISKRGFDANSSEYDQRVAATTLAALAFAGEPNEALGTTLTSLKQKLSTYAMGVTIIGLSEMDKKKDMEELLPLFIEKLTDHMNLTDSAVAVMAISRADPRHQALPYLLQSMITNDGVDNKNPIITAETLAAYATYIECIKKPPAPKVLIAVDGQDIDRKNIKEENSVQYSVDLPFAENEKVLIKNENNKTVYFDIKANVREKFSTDPKSRVARGINLFSTIEDKDGKEVNWEALKLGDLYHVRIYVKADEDITAFFLDYALPAGITPLNVVEPQGGSTAEGIEALAKAEKNDEGGDRRHILIERAQQSLTHTEYHSDYVRFFADNLPQGFYCFDFYMRASSAGIFLMPPAESGSMINTSTMVRLPATKVHVEE